MQVYQQRSISSFSGLTHKDILLEKFRTEKKGYIFYDGSNASKSEILRTYSNITDYFLTNGYSNAIITCLQPYKSAEIGGFELEPNNVFKVVKRGNDFFREEFTFDQLADYLLANEDSFIGDYLLYDLDNFSRYPVSGAGANGLILNFPKGAYDRCSFIEANQQIQKLDLFVKQSGSRLILQVYDEIDHPNVPKYNRFLFFGNSNITYQAIAVSNGVTKIQTFTNDTLINF